MPPRIARLVLPALIVVAGLQLACGEDDHGPTPLPCTYTLSITSAAFDSNGGSGTVSVSADATCQWTSASNVTWITVVSGANNTGSGSAAFQVAPNTSEPPRSGVLLVAGQTVTITQAGRPACTYDVSPPPHTFPAGGGNGTIQIKTTAQCAWTAATTESWVVITSGASGQGDGQVAFTVAGNSATSVRAGHITAAGLAVTINQLAAEPTPDCQYTVAPVEISPCMSVPFDLTFTVGTQQACTWTATTGTPWITITGGQSGNGSGSVSFRVTDNWDAPRQDLVMVRWPTPTLGQNVRVLQAGCYYAVSKSSFDLAAGGGSANFDVIQQSDPNTCGGALQNACLWSAVSQVSWITITSSMPRRGDDRVSFTVAPNNSTNARVGTITVRDKVVQVIQAGQ